MHDSQKYNWFVNGTDIQTRKQKRKQEGIKWGTGLPGLAVNQKQTNINEKKVLSSLSHYIPCFSLEINNT